MWYSDSRFRYSPATKCAGKPLNISVSPHKVPPENAPKTELPGFSIKVVWARTRSSGKTMWTGKFTLLAQDGGKQTRKRPEAKVSASWGSISVDIYPIQPLPVFLFTFSRLLFIFKRSAYPSYTSRLI